MICGIIETALKIITKRDIACREAENILLDQRLFQHSASSGHSHAINTSETS